MTHKFSWARYKLWYSENKSKLPEATILNKQSVDFFTFQHNFMSPQVEQNLIIINKNSVYEMPDELLDNLKS